MEEATKQCNRCKEVKPLTAFYPNPILSDGRQGKCSDCTREVAHLAYLKKMGKTETMKRHTIDSPVASKEGCRICTLCGEEKLLEEFEIDKRKELGHTFRCKACAKAYKNKWTKDGGEEYREKKKVYREENRDMLLAGKKRHYMENQEHYREKGKEYYLEHQEEYRQYGKTRRECMRGNDAKLLPDKLRNQVRKILFAKRTSKKARDFIGCSALEFQEHIKSLWKEGMTWDNYGPSRLGAYSWQIDHILPISSFNLSDPIQLAKCFHYTNMQPLWWQENASKHNNIT